MSDLSDEKKQERYSHYMSRLNGSNKRKRSSDSIHSSDDKELSNRRKRPQTTPEGLVMHIRV